MPYPERLASLKLPSLGHRCNRGDMIDLWKYVLEYYNVDCSCFDPVTQSQHNTRENSFKLPKKYGRLHVRSNSFYHRVVDLWNSLPDFVVLA
ncbi:hypothetical protein Ahia01_000093000 [Argonauta hians]